MVRAGYEKNYNSVHNSMEKVTTPLSDSSPTRRIQCPGHCSSDPDCIYRVRMTKSRELHTIVLIRSFVIGLHRDNKKGKSSIPLTPGSSVSIFIHPLDSKLNILV